LLTFLHKTSPFTRMGAWLLTTYYYSLQALEKQEKNAGQNR
jgi:hypothetical protein